MYLERIIQNSFPFVRKCLPLLSNNFVENHTMIKYNPIGVRTFEGNGVCRETSYLLGMYLRHHKCPVSYHYYKTGYGNNVQEHLYIKAGNIIIDPTWRQFFSSYSKEKNKYLEYLYDELDYCFVGNGSDLEYLYIDLQDKHYDDFNRYLEKDLLKFWKESWEVPFAEQNTHYLDKIQPILTKYNTDDIDMDSITNDNVRNIIDRYADKYMKEML